MSDSAKVVAEIVREALGERPVSVEHVPTLEESDVFRVHLASGVVYFKAEHEGHPIAVAAWAYEKAASVGVPVPEVLHLDLTRERWPEEFVLMTAVTGTDPNTTRSRDQNSCKRSKDTVACSGGCTAFRSKGSGNWASPPRRPRNPLDHSLITRRMCERALTGGCLV